MDFDVIQISNIHRQYLYLPKEIGLQKVVIASQKLKEINTKINIISYQTPLTQVRH